MYFTCGSVHSDQGWKRLYRPPRSYRCFGSGSFTRKWRLKYKLERKFVTNARKGFWEPLILKKKCGDYHRHLLVAYTHAQTPALGNPGGMGRFFYVKRKSKTLCSLGPTATALIKNIEKKTWRVLKKKNKSRVPPKAGGGAQSSNKAP